MLPAHYRVERRGDGWVARDGDGAYWCGLMENAWAPDAESQGEYLLTFPTEGEAAAAYAQAARMYGEREKRHERAMAQLGLTDE